MTASNYYFSSSEGNDSRSALEARNSATPWKTLSKLNQLSNLLQPGDAILFKRGDIFEGSITINRSGSSTLPIVFSAYGTGSKPEISGFTALTNWNSIGNGIWETTVPSATSNINIVLVNGVAKAVGRYPNSTDHNKGYLNFESYNGKSSITDMQLSSNPNWTGGEVVIRKNRWVLDKNQILSHSGNTINYASQSGYEAANGYGYFIQNHPATLDIAGEWYHRSTDKKFGIYTGNVNPSILQVRVGIVATLVQVANNSNIVFNNLCFTGATTTAFDVKYAQNIQVTNCDIFFSGKNAIDAVEATNLIIENSNIQHSNNIAFKADNCTGTIFKNNKIKSTGVFPGMGDGDSGSYNGVMIGGDNNLVENNQIDSIGYVPLSFGGNNVIIKNNFISNYALIKDDGGGIYTWNNGGNAPVNSGRVVSGNIIINGKGAGEGTPEPGKLFAHGIYIDDNASHVEIINNTVADCAAYGLYIHNAHDITIKQNTIYNNGVQMVLEHDNIAADKPIYNIVATENIFLSKQSSQLVAEFKTKNNDIANFGTFNNNYYARPIDDNLVIKVLQQVNGVYSYNNMSLDTWKSLYGKDLQSKKSPQQIPAFTITNSGSNKFPNGIFNENINGLYAYAPANNSNASWSTGTLDGGSLKLSFSNVSGKADRASVIIGIGAVTKDKKYQLKFSMLGTGENKTLYSFLRQSAGSYSDLSERKGKTIMENRSELDFIFTATASESNASIVLDIEEQTVPLYFDNIQLIEVEGNVSNPDDYVRFFYNPTNTSKGFHLSIPGIDVKNNSYSETFSLGPFSSSVLLSMEAKLETPTSQCPSTGTISRDVWSNIPGDHLSSVNFQTPTTNSGELSNFESPINYAENFAERIRGYICPPSSGNYTFLVAGDDAVELYLSTNDNPVNKVKIASASSWTNYREWYKFPSQKSVQINLQAGTRYYVEALHKEGIYGDHLSVAWILPNGQLEAPISGSRLSPFSSSATGQTITFQPIESKTFNGSPFTIGATTSSGLPVSFRIVSGPATIAANTLTMTGVGIVVVEASQAGDTNFIAASSVTQSFEITSAANPTTCSATGNILREVWTNISGDNITNVNFQTAPANSSQLSSFENPIDYADNYGDRIRGYICPPSSGNYSFLVAGDDAVELYLSTNDDPANKVKIAYVPGWTNYREWYKFPSQKSVQIYLQAGSRYYVEALHKEGNYGDHLSVAWILPDGQLEAPISGSRLSPFNQVGIPQTIIFSPIPSKESNTAPFTVNATATSGLFTNFRVISGPAIISENVISVTGIGTVIVEAAQVGNAIYNAATPVTQTFEVTAPSNVPNCSATGTILREVWTNISASNLLDVPFQTTPNATNLISQLEGPKDVADNYATRIRGYICAPQSGSYTFWISGDDDSELWLSSDVTPGNKNKVAFLSGWTGYREWNKFSSQKSALISLEAGQKYYIEVLSRDGWGGDNVSVQWQLPNGITEAPISGQHLSPFTLPALTAAPGVHSGTGGISWEYWGNVTGTTASSIPLNTTPTGTKMLTNFATNHNMSDFFGERIRGYVCPPHTGYYVFYIASDDQGELWLSTDDGITNKKKIAYTNEWTNPGEYNKFFTQESEPIYLQSGQRYYIETLHNEGLGGDHLSVGWKLPNGVLERPILGSNLMPFDNATKVMATSISSDNSLVLNSLTQSEFPIIPSSLSERTTMEFTVFPNPVSNQATLEFTSFQSGEGILNLYDLQGRLILEIFKGNINSGVKNRKVLSTQNLENGTYIVRLMIGKNMLAKKVLIQKD
ncbi:MAG: T9SS type A sorting domain-containing protein [Pyrinomonadaceae bacterium]|nr:T9SS type A sorting domain-containing protein [Sphingobacteriaceae bacterium]